MMYARFAIGVWLTGFCALTPAHGQTRIEPLAAVRAKLAAPPYDAAERTLLARQTRLVLEELFVHRELKIEDFGPHRTCRDSAWEKNIEIGYVHK